MQESTAREIYNAILLLTEKRRRWQFYAFSPKSSEKGTEEWRTGEKESGRQWFSGGIYRFGFSRLLFRDKFSVDVGGSARGHRLYAKQRVSAFPHRRFIRGSTAKPLRSARSGKDFARPSSYL